MSYFKKYNSKFKKQNRRRKIPLIRILLVVASVYYFVNYALSKQNNTALEIQNAAIIPTFKQTDVAHVKADSLLKNSIHKTSCVVKIGDTFYGILSQLDISNDISNKIYGTLITLGFPSLFPGDSVIVKRKGNGNFDSLSLLSKNQHWYIVSDYDSILKAEKRPLKVSKYIYLINGTLETSISEAMQQKGVSDVITWKFADIFAWDINFFLDPRKGDKFQIIFEQKYAEGLYNGYGDILAARYFSGDKIYSAFGLRDTNGNISYFDEDGKAVQKQFLKAPLKYTRVSSTFSHKRKHPILGIVRPHLGIDYAAPAGTPVQAAADGKVHFAGYNGGYGNLIIISHGGTYETYYGHLLSFGKNIKTGKNVIQGQVIGRVGATGLATGPHLDYRMKQGSQFINPSNITASSKKQIDLSQKDEFSEIKQYCSNGFNYRFSMSDGLHIIEIKRSDSIGETSNQIIKLSKRDE